MMGNHHHGKVDVGLPTSLDYQQAWL
jgi:hypothetical protein